MQAKSLMFCRRDLALNQCVWCVCYPVHNHPRLPVEKFLFLLNCRDRDHFSRADSAERNRKPRLTVDGQNAKAHLDRFEMDCRPTMVVAEQGRKKV